MIREVCLRLGLGLVLFPFVAWAQSGGHHGNTAATPSVEVPAKPAEDADLTRFKHAIEVQATEAQMAQFRTLASTTLAAQQRARAMRQLAVSESLAAHAQDLQDSVEEAQQQTLRFVQSFSDSQESGLKKLVRRLGTADAAVAKQADELATGLNQIPFDSRRIIAAAAGLEKSLSRLQAGQVNLAHEMGIDTR